MSTKDLEEITHASYRQLDSWIRLGYISDMKGKGSGYRRTWTEAALNKARLMAELVNLVGITPSKASPIADQMLERPGNGGWTYITLVQNFYALCYRRPFPWQTDQSPFTQAAPGDVARSSTGAEVSRARIGRRPGCKTRTQESGVQYTGPGTLTTGVVKSSPTTRSEGRLG